MRTLVVSHIVPLLGSQGEGGVVFCQWLPEGVEHAIDMSTDGINL